MFNKKKNMAKQGKNGNGNGIMPAVNLISEGTEIQGEIKSNDDIRIDGTLTGVIHSKSKVVIGSTGKVNGEIYCQSADVLGKLEGTVNAADILYLKTSAKIDGDIKTGKLVVESGATFNGKCHMGSSKFDQGKEKRIESKQETPGQQEATPRQQEERQPQQQRRSKAAV
jgi:cytoskeletal protein CcmA (bactofilin family)